MIVNKVHSLPAYKKQYSKEYKFMILLLKSLQLLFGINFGFISSKSLKTYLIFYLIPITHNVALFILIIEYCLKVYDWYKTWTIHYFLQYLVAIIVFLFCKRDNTFKYLLVSLDEIDVQLQVDFATNRTELKFIMIILSIFLERFLISAFFYFSPANQYCVNSIFSVYTFTIFSPCMDVILCTFSYTIYLMYLRLAKLPSLLENNDDVVIVQRLYKTIVDSLEKYKKAYDSVFMVILLCHVPLVMTAIYFTLKISQKSADMTTLLVLGVEYIYVFVTIVFTIAPALIAEMLTSQAETIRIKLHDKMLLPEVQHKASLTQFIRYVEARSCRYSVWKLVPLSADLLGMVLGFCATYLIVIIQFTHLK